MSLIFLKSWQDGQGDSLLYLLYLNFWTLGRLSISFHLPSAMTVPEVEHAVNALREQVQGSEAA